jgi:hypothetical protein
MRCSWRPTRGRFTAHLGSTIESAVHYIGDGTNHWSLVRVEDIAELYCLALGAPSPRYS